MKRIFLTMFLAVLIQAANISIVSAVEYLDGNSNFPLSWGHAGYFEYVDLTSCMFVSNEGNFYEIAANYIGYSRMYGKTYGTRHFRQNNGELPQYFDERTNSWIIIPDCTTEEAKNYRNTHAYTDFETKYHYKEYCMFLIVYKKLFGIDYN